MKRLALSLALIALPGLASALDCTATQSELIDALPGTWTAQNSVGMLSMAGRTIPLPPRNAGTGIIRQQGDGLVVQDWGVPGVFDVQFVTDARFVLNPDENTLVDGDELFWPDLSDVVSSDDTALIAGCTDGAVPPQIQISGSFQDAEGTVDFDVYLFVVDENVMYGVTSGRLKAMNGHAKRITTWTRTGG